MLSIQWVKPTRIQSYEANQQLFFVTMTSESIRQRSLQKALPEEAEENEKEGQQEWINGDSL